METTKLVAWLLNNRAPVESNPNIMEWYNTCRLNVTYDDLPELKRLADGPDEFLAAQAVAAAWALNEDLEHPDRDCALPRPVIDQDPLPGVL